MLQPATSIAGNGDEKWYNGDDLCYHNMHGELQPATKNAGTDDEKCYDGRRRWNRASTFVGTGISECWNQPARMLQPAGQTSCRDCFGPATVDATTGGRRALPPAASELQPAWSSTTGGLERRRAACCNGYILRMSTGLGHGADGAAFVPHRNCTRVGWRRR